MVECKLVCLDDGSSRGHAHFTHAPRKFLRHLPERFCARLNTFLAELRTESTLPTPPTTHLLHGADTSKQTPCTLALISLVHFLIYTESQVRKGYWVAWSGQEICHQNDVRGVALNGRLRETDPCCSLNKQNTELVSDHVIRKASKRGGGIEIC